ncbi:MAG: CoA ester lyase [Pseudomonadales bacterium]|jgi:citrate lyase subunit beta/citryl-CoA lyase|nr:CoA ester lyase [Pseudomonadales bacterium]HJN49700.1 CoA ester lyase [Pseudomonadales bacterium]|tara:strand:- start:678 stop:1733 length:1056 start_codon:yes stop_codon:yes gene_type:complete
MSSRPRRLRRCQLSVPGSSEKMMTKAAGLELDHVFLDLEDAVAPDAKAAARGMVVDALNNLDWKPKTLCYRINDVETKYCFEDIIEVVTGAGDKLDTIMLTKAKSAHDIMFVHLLLDQLEKKLGLKKRIGIECLIEEVEGMMNVDEIAASSDRLECLVFGMGDYSASQGMDLRGIGSASSYPPDLWHYPRYRMTIACRANGIDPVDGPYANFGNPEGYRVECGRCKVLGMVGKWAIHPSQVELAQEVFSPTAEAVANARKQKAAYEEAMARGIGAITVDGVMVDVASVRILQNIIDQADLIGMKAPAAKKRPTANKSTKKKSVAKKKPVAKRRAAKTRVAQKTAAKKSSRR